MATICWALFGIQEIGLIIEEPFGKMLELDSICKSIQHDVKETMPWASLTASEAQAEKEVQRTGAAEAARDAEVVDTAIEAGAVPVAPGWVIAGRP